MRRAAPRPGLFITGSDATKFGGGGFLTLTVSITPTGTVGDLLPILSIPGQMAQTYTNLMPAGSIPTQMAQHATNFIETAAGTGVTATVAAVPDATGTPISGILPGLLYYLPANLAAAIGGPPAPVIPPVPS
jgi:hypothetical protein